MESLAARLFREKSFGEMLDLIYPQDVLSSSYDDYRRGKYTNTFYTQPHILPYASEELTNIFLGRLSPLLTNEFKDEEDRRDYFLEILDRILKIILSEGRIMIGTKGDPFLWQQHNGLYYLFSVVLNEQGTRREESYTIYDSLDGVLRGILVISPNAKVTYNTPYYVVEEQTRNTLVCLKSLQSANIATLKSLFNARLFYNILSPSTYFSFYPFNSLDIGYIILTKHGLSILGLDEENHVIDEVFRLEDLELVLASEAYNIEDYSLFGIDENFLDEEMDL